MASCNSITKLVVPVDAIFLPFILLMSTAVPESGLLLFMRIKKLFATIHFFNKQEKIKILKHILIKNHNLISKYQF
ncbi:hypothetical protein DN752_22190 [Echinicola strongylocentroti]|uniref:Uncharacterized protein n=1 Tax=Echinicola strongylocentroti TaxID=1795355 RepID=A0A2Z4IPB3_9BACT|nr:hypothetical protein DN752_22190 [Echinicola strongylocentroti]